MQNLKILNKKEIKKILSMLDSQWGFNDKLDYAFLETEKGKIYIAGKDAFSLDLSKLRINSIGLYFAEARNGIRLSIEGSQIVGPSAKKNVVDLDSRNAKAWMRGEDIGNPTECTGFVILRHGSDFLGTGNATKDGKILNFVPKVRRITYSYS